MFIPGCSPPEPIHIGFLGGVSGRVADLGIAGRDGALLAVEERNARGGVVGRQIKLVVEDDLQDPQAAHQAMDRLVAQHVAAVVGPMTSAVAVAVVPQANAAGLTLVAPTVTTNDLTGIDDQFFRVVAPTAGHVGKSAQHHYKNLGLRRIAMAYDLRNKAYAQSWSGDFRKAFQALGGAVIFEESFTSSDSLVFTQLAEKLLASAPDGVVVIANSVDAALLIQKLRQRAPSIAIATSEWAATERLIDLGGRALEGVVVAQYVDRNSPVPTYVRFRAAYQKRFEREPGFAGLAAFDATNVVLDGLQAQQSGQTLKQALLTQREFVGAQSTIRFDDTGDTHRETYLSVIHNGEFQPLPTN